uniref:Reverse transcriptase domain-containing protein n=1 Tax=Bracon brevicornis TaxID=1563983 RepID=A0A6V7IK75_9HYME
MPINFILSYADDTVIIASDDTWGLAQDRMNGYLDQVSTWLALNRLSLNINKTVYMTFGNYCDSVPIALDITIQSQRVTRVEKHKYLGIHFDFNMKWDIHIANIIKRTKYLIFILAELKRSMDSKTQLILYYAFFHSIINYGITAWSGAYKNNMSMLQRQQTMIMKIIDRSGTFEGSPPLNINQLLTLESLMLHYEPLKSMYGNIERNTRYKSLQISKLNRVVGTKNYYFVAIRAFNQLPNNLKVLNCNKESVKKRLKAFMGAVY